MIIRSQSFVRIAVIFLLISLSGCSALLNSAQEKDQSPQSGALDTLPPEPGETEPIDEVLPDDMAEPGIKPPPDYTTPPPPPPMERTNVRSKIADEKRAIAKTAYEFAQNFKSVSHIKFCYSKLDQAWMLHLYHDIKGKGQVWEIFRWMAPSSEWDLVRKKEKVEGDKLAFHVQTEMPGETCFLVDAKSGRIEVDRVESQEVEELFKDSAKSDKPSRKPEKPGSKPAGPVSEPPRASPIQGEGLVKPELNGGGDNLIPAR